MYVRPVERDIWSTAQNRSSRVENVLRLNCGVTAVLYVTRPMRVLAICVLAGKK